MANDILNGQEEIDLLKLIQALWKKAWIVIAAAILGGIIFLTYTIFLVAPQYTTNALLYVNNAVSVGNAKISISSSDIYASNSLVSTFSVILKSRKTLEAVIDEGQFNLTYEQLVDKVKGGAEGDTSVFKITVTDTDRERAANIANTIVEVMTENIADIVEGSSVKVVDFAVVPTKASSPSFFKNTAIGMIIGFVLACGIIILRTLMDSTIRDEEFLLDKYKNIPVLATIPDLSQGSQGGYYGYGKAYARSYAHANDKARKAAKERQELERLERQEQREQNKRPGDRAGDRAAETHTESPFVNSDYNGEG